MAVLARQDADWNWNMFVHTVRTLASSQGFYSRLQRQLDESSKEDLEFNKEQINALPKFNDELDVILWLEA